MKKRIVSLCMVLFLCLGLLPATALAADGDVVYVGGVELTGSTSNPAYATTDAGGNVITDGADENNYNIKWDGSTLTLHNATITARYEGGDNISLAGIYAAASEGRPVSLTIELQGENNQVSGTHGIFVYSHSDGAATLNITGSGSLTANGSSSGIMVQSNSGDTTLTIQDADVTGQSAYGGGVTVRAGQIGAGECTITLSVEGGSLTASGNTGIIFDSADPGTVSATNLTVSNNAIVRANDVISYIPGVNLQIGAGNDSPGGIVFDGNEGTVYGSVTLQENLTIGAGESLTLDNGASLNADGHNVIVDGGMLDDGLESILGDSVKYTPSITTDSLSSGTVGTPYSQTLVAGGTAPIAWNVSGSLPAGLSLNGNTISGTPTTAGTSTFTVTATNGYGSGDSKEFSITINQAQDTTPPALTAGSATRTGETTATVTFTSNEDGTYYYEVVESDAPQPTIDTDGQGTDCDTTEQTISLDSLTGAGSKDIYIVVKDAEGNVSDSTFKIEIPDYVAPSYSISVTPQSLLFGSAAEGYTTAPAAQSVIMMNTGNQNVTVTLPTSVNYIITAETGFTNGTATLAPNGRAQFTVQPKVGLEIGTYNETITISGSDGAGTSLTASFTVSAIPVTGVSLNTSTLRLPEGGTGTLIAAVEPDNATNQNVTWSSDNESVATVNDGVVTAAAAGTATITVTTEDGNKIATCVVTVTHGSLTHTPGNDATCTEDGNKEYWTCDICGTHFSDAGGKVEIPLSDTVVAAKGHSYVDGKCSVCDAPEPGFKPVITAGTGGTWQKGSRDGLSFTSNAAFADFVKVQVDGRDLAASDYEVREGSTIVTLNASYLETLSVGTHTLAIVSDTGTATTEFTIHAAPATEDNTPSPQTGDNSNITLWIVLMLISGGAGIVLSTGYVKRRKN